ncbi:MAG: SIMPL domain-containing protein [Endomicrobiia bacterium]|nr:SIMPL domain-containing protein [Endomicrobiaceae bacterium]
MDKKTAYIVSLGLIISSLILGIFFVMAKQPEQSIRVVGQGTKNIISDIAKWNINISKNTGIGNQQEGYISVQNDLKKIRKFLNNNDIENKDILLEPITSYPLYGNNGISGYSFNQKVVVRSNDVAKIENMALDIEAMSKADIFLQNSTIEYFISNLAEMKAEMLAIATVDAKSRAEEIAKSTGNKVCNLISAKSGVFQIRQPLSTDVSDYGIYNTSSKEKEVVVTVSALFNIK